jgi:hypothetical protein
MKIRADYGNVIGCAITWDFKWEKEILIMLPFLIIVINFNNEDYEM